METFFFHQDIIIITANAAGEKYLIKAKSIQDILDDWNGTVNSFRQTMRVYFILSGMGDQLTLPGILISVH